LNFHIIFDFLVLFVTVLIAAKIGVIQISCPHNIRKLLLTSKPAAKIFWFPTAEIHASTTDPAQVMTQIFTTGNMTL
jgi:hypothetical protein